MSSSEHAHIASRWSRGPDAGQTRSTQTRLFRLGTNPECDLELNDSTASRFHAHIEIDEWGHRLVDDGSKNGTFVNEMRVKDVYLTTGCRIQIGATVIQYDTETKRVDIFLSRTHQFGQLIGKSAAMREIFAILERVAPTDTTLLIEGEAALEELVADAVHQHSRRQPAHSLCSIVLRSRLT